MNLFKQLDQHLLELAWTLWTKLGVVGHERRHHNCLICLEELVLLNISLVEKDPRLRDERLSTILII